MTKVGFEVRFAFLYFLRNFTEAGFKLFTVNDSENYFSIPFIAVNSLNAPYSHLM
jgi:hypothetical protein